MSLGRSLSYRFTRHASQSADLTLLFLPGFRSDMQGLKAQRVEEMAARLQCHSLLFDYSGHGQSAGELDQCNLSLWLEDSLQMVRDVAPGRVVLIGASMGGWIAHLLALKLPSKVCGLVAVGCAPDFTEELIYRRLLPGQKTVLEQTGRVEIESRYSPTNTCVTWDLIADARQHLLLQSHSSLPITVPARYLHGLQDVDVPYEYSIRLAQRMTQCKDLQVTLDGASDHRFSTAKSLDLLERTVAGLFAVSQQHRKTENLPQSPM